MVSGVELAHVSVVRSVFSCCTIIPSTATFRWMTPVDCSAWFDEIAAGHSKSLQCWNNVHSVLTPYECLWRQFIAGFRLGTTVYPRLALALVRWSLLRGKEMTLWESGQHTTVNVNCLSAPEI